mmetsp:Transcript_5625/g.8401  ORF Transcript_5625/g.8401 Transcript_5625/m.8401 type:complete len:547 (-) Transcript_5625:376-2016(-)
MATYMTSNITNIKADQTTSKDTTCVPSGFVLKLYQMVNEAPDEIIAWLPSGDAFRISNLQRLENETLPTFFRHRRFQSLVRQLNFYNFRKVNRERTFWVYRHNLFHRDRPGELHLLRRRTCPGVDGRKQRSENDPSRSNSPRPTSKRNYLSTDEQSENDSVVAPPSGKNKRKVRQASDDFEMKRLKRKSHNIGTDSRLPSPAPEVEINDTTKILDMSEVNDTNAQEQESPSTVICSESPTHVVPPEGDDLKGPNGLPKRTVSPNIFGDSLEKKERSNSLEQSMLVTKVARKLEEHAKRAAAAKGICSKRRSGTVTPPFSSDTMKYHALTYDDEIEIYDSARGCVVERQQRVMTSSHADENLSIVSNDDEDRVRSVSFYGCTQKMSTTPPVENNIIVSDIVRKLHGWVKQGTFTSKVDGQLAAAIAGFCMLTNPRDPSFEKKCTDLMLACGALVTEFRRYKTALLPGCIPHDGLMQNNPPRLDLQIKQLFNGDKNHTVRVFKVFLLNSLEDLVNDKHLPIQVGLSSKETESMDSCYKIWLTSLRHSS